MKAEQKLNLYATIGSTARNMIALLDNSYRYLEANQAYLDACGLTLEQLLERTMPEVFGEEFFAHTIQPHTDRCLAGKEISREAWYEFPTHGSRFMAVTYTPYLVPDTGVKGFIVNAHDITQYKQTQLKLQESEKKSRAWLENSPVCTKIVDLELNLQYMSSAEIKTLNIVDVNEHYGKPYPFHFYPEDFKILMSEKMKKVIESGEITTLEAPANNIDGNEIWFHSTLLPVLDDKRQIEYLIIVSIETTGRKQAENRLRQSEKLQAIGQLAGGVAHDFNNQLTVIANYAYLAKMEVIENSTASHYLDQVISGTMRSADLTKSLLAFARKGKYTIKTLNMNTVIAEAVSIVKHSFAKNIEISQHLNADPSTISGDLNQLQNALINIALNSRDAMPSGGKLVVSTETIQIDNSHPGVIAQDLSSGEHLKVCVRDTGNGMDPKTLSRIFEPFFTTKEKGTSLGMGMASVDGAVVSHHGFIEVCSTPGEGTSVTILFPTVALEPTEISAPNLKRPRGCGRILIVDDEEMVAASMKLILSAEGYELITYLNATDAIKNYEKSWRNIDLVLLDMIMPDLDGDEVYQAMRKINPDAKVLLLSGFSMTEKAKKALSEGARGFLQKPVITEELLHQIADTLGRAEETKPLPTTP